jgi:hypothetical protein
MASSIRRAFPSWARLLAQTILSLSELLFNLTMLMVEAPRQIPNDSITLPIPGSAAATSRISEG